MVPTKTTLMDRPCDKLAVVTALVKGNSVSANGTRGCGGKSSDALLIKYCSAPPSTQWKRGIHIKEHCSIVKHYIPIGEWNGQTFTDVDGVLVSCDNGTIQIISQSCGSSLSLHNITSPSADSMYTTGWS